MISWWPLTMWPFDLTVYAGLVLLYFGHAWLASGAADAERKHTLYFLAGLFTLWVALETPIDPLSDSYLDSVHMLQHVLLAFVAPPLLLLGLSPGMVSRLVRVPGVRASTEPIPAQVIAGVRASRELASGYRPYRRCRDRPPCHRSSKRRRRLRYAAAASSRT